MNNTSSQKFGGFFEGIIGYSGVKEELYQILDMMYYRRWFSWYEPSGRVKQADGHLTVFAGKRLPRRA
jgi:hypothetical protein